LHVSKHLLIISQPCVQALVHAGILRSSRGPLGWYEPVREWERISLADILRGLGVRETDLQSLWQSAIARSMVSPALQEAEDAYFTVLARISLAELARAANRSAKPKKPKYETRGTAAICYLRYRPHDQSSARSYCRCSCGMILRRVASHASMSALP
jgi:DNA-binding IscR family transcriptional regulator